MSKWYGKIGFADEVEYEPGCYEPMIKEYPYPGDIISNRWKRQNSSESNDSINLSIKISIIADQYVLNHIHTIAYVTHMGAKWKVTDIDFDSRRLILTIGGIWNEESSGAS